MWEQMVPVLRNKNAQLIIVGTMGSAVGAAAGYFTAQKRLEKKYADIAESEIEEARHYYALKVDEAKPSLEELAEKLGYGDPKPAVIEVSEEETISYVDSDDHPVERTERISYNVFRDASQGAIPMDPLMENRGDSKIYVITVDEFNENEDNYTQLELSYFEGDHVLSDEKDSPIEDMEKIIGPDALDRFGHGSKDPNIVYVRNHNLEVDMCITRSDGKFTVMVLGMDDPDELRHSERIRKNRKFRGDDE